MVRLSCGVQCARSTLFVFNVIFLFFGLLILALGIYIKVDGNFNVIIAASNITQALGGEAMQWIGIVLIIVGVLTSCLAAFGCLGAICQNRGLLYTYAIILTLIILLEFASVIFVLKYRDALWKSYDSGFSQVFQNAYLYHHQDTINIIEKIEEEFKCCGVDGVLDYTKVGFSVPASCYPNKEHTGLPFTKGCAEGVALWVWDQLPIFAAVLGTILFVELFGVISSLVLGVAISHSLNTNIYYKL